ncbi:MAG: YihY/virulence factor BrkB family protein [Pseudonocardia sp.]|nr:YihY/virulence factor BrkB family protein [Pseudonocardia sp.]
MAWVDAFQQRHAWLALPFAVYRKFADDQAGNLAALIAYYAFFSVFPLLLVLTTILGYVLAGNPALEQRVFSTALGQFPIIGQRDAAQPLTGNPAGLVIGLVLAIWSGLGVAQMAQQAFNRIHGVPRADWPGFLLRLVRSLEVVIIGGLGLTITTLIQGAVSDAEVYGLRLGVVGAVVGALIGVVLNAGLFTYLFQRLTVRSLSWREVIVGAAIAAIAWFMLQKIGFSLVNREVRGATRTYGTFAVVIGLLFWFHLLSQITLYCAELNIVLIQRLWPRSLISMIEARAASAADRRAYQSYPKLERQVHNVRVQTQVTDQDTTHR